MADEAADTGEVCACGDRSPGAELPHDAVRWCLGLAPDAPVTVAEAAAALRILHRSGIADGGVRVDRAVEWGQPAHRASRGGWLVVEGGGRPRGLCVGIVGTRRVPAREVSRVERHVRALLGDARLTLVSGGARGADAIAHDVAADLGRPAVIVLAGGLAHAGPRPHRAAWRTLVGQGGALVTMRPPGEPPQRGAWLQRNRLIAALADVLCVVAAPDRSGALSTVRHARELGRPVCVMPWPVDESWAAGSNRLLDEPGVTVWHDVAAVHAHLGVSSAGRPGARATDVEGPARTLDGVLTPDARALLDAIGAAPLLGLDGAAATLGWSAPRLQRARLELDLAGVRIGGA